MPHDGQENAWATRDREGRARAVAKQRRATGRAAEHEIPNRPQGVEASSRARPTSTRSPIGEHDEIPNRRAGRAAEHDRRARDPQSASTTRSPIDDRRAGRAAASRARPNRQWPRHERREAREKTAAPPPETESRDGVRPGLGTRGRG
jgi:hypothetical protein